MSAQRKLISVLYQPLRVQRLAIGPSFRMSRSRSIAMTSRARAPGGQQPTAAENVPETSKDDTKPVPSEQITEEAKKQEPDAGEQVQEVSPTRLIVCGVDNETDCPD